MDHIFVHWKTHEMYNQNINNMTALKIVFHCSYFSLVVVLVSRNQKSRTTRLTIKYFFEKVFVHFFQDRSSRFFQLQKITLQRHDALTFGEYQTFYKLSG